MTALLPLAWGLVVLSTALDWSGAVAPAQRRPPARRSSHRRSVPRWAAPVAAGVLAAGFTPLLAPVGVGAVLARRALAQRALARRRVGEVVAELPEVVDLFVLATGAGGNVAFAVTAVARHAPPRFAAELTAALDRTRAGVRLADALGALPGALGEPARPLVAALVASERYGAPLLPALERLAADARGDRRRRADEAARRVPVALLFPLVLCVLPAFGLLTLVPLVAGAVGQLGR